MKVKELISKLKNLNPEHTIVMVVDGGDIKLVLDEGEYVAMYD